MGYHLACKAAEVVACMLALAVYVIVYDLDETLISSMDLRQCFDTTAKINDHLAR